MPYKRTGKTIYKKTGGKWKKKSTCKSEASAKKQLNLLRGVEHGWEPTRSKQKRRKK